MTLNKRIDQDGNFGGLKFRAVWTRINPKRSWCEIKPKDLTE